MKCDKCKQEFEEKEIQLSHDVPRYIGGLDSDGRHYLCKKCHDIYEKICFSIMCKDLPEIDRKKMRESAKKFAKRWFNDTRPT